LPTRWAIMVFAGLLLAPLSLAVAQGAPLSGPYIVVALAWRTLSSFVIIWLACAVRQLDAARVRLAEDAVVRERLRITMELGGRSASPSSRSSVEQSTPARWPRTPPARPKRRCAS